MNRHFIKIALLSAIPLFVIFFFRYVYLYSVNFPYYDDFGDCAGLVAQWEGTASGWGKIKLLFEQNFDHRVLFLKLICISYYLLTSHLNITILILIGDLALVGIWLQFYLLASRSLSHAWLLVAIAALLFQVQHFESSILWMTCALQHAPCIFLTTFAVQLALQNRASWAMVVALVAMLSSANGILAPILVLGVLFLTKRYQPLWWAIPLYLLIAAWHLSTLTLYSGGRLTHLLYGQPAKLLALLAFAGGFSRLFTESLLVNQLVGVFFLFPMLLGIYQLFFLRYRTSFSFLQWISLAGLLFVWFTAVLVTQLRNESVDYSFLQLARYNIYYPFFPIFSLGLLFFTAHPNPIQRYVAPAITMVSFFFCILTYYHYQGSILEYRKEISLNQPNYAWSKLIYYPPIFEDAASVEHFESLRQKGLLSRQHPFMNFIPELDLSVIKDTLKSARMQQFSDYAEIRDTSLVVNNKNKEDGIYILLTDQHKSPRYAFYAHHAYPTAYRIFFRQFYRPMAPGFFNQFHFKDLKPGAYEVLVVKVEEAMVQKLYHLAVIQIDHQAG